VILDAHSESDRHQNLITSRGSLTHPGLCLPSLVDFHKRIRELHSRQTHVHTDTRDDHNT